MSATNGCQATCSVHPLNAVCIGACVRYHLRVAANDFNVEGPPLIGSFNAVYCILFNGSRYALRVPLDEHFDAVRFEADVQILDLITKRTSIRAPKLVAASVSRDPHLGHPFLLTDFIPGTSLADLWYDVEWINPSRRARIFHQLAEQMLQLEVFTFDKLGDLVFRDGNLEVGPIRHFNPSDSSAIHSRPALPPTRNASMGPFNRVSDLYLDCYVQHMEDCAPEDPWIVWYRMVVGAFHDRQLDKPPFVLCHPDLDLQNILIDPETGDINGIIDWDRVSQTQSRSTGFARFPAWLLRDWDPFLYGYSGFRAVAASVRSSSPSAQDDEPESSSSANPSVCTTPPDEHSFGGGSPLEAPVHVARRSSPTPEQPSFEPSDVLEQYRAEYVSVVRAIKPRWAGVTARSHMACTLDTALRCEIPRGGMGFKFAQYVFGSQFVNPFDIPLAIRDGAHRREQLVESASQHLASPDGPIHEQGVTNKQEGKEKPRRSACSVIARMLKPWTWLCLG